MKRKVKKPIQRKSSQNDESMEGSIPALPAEPGTLKVLTVRTIKLWNINTVLYEFDVVVIKHIVSSEIKLISVCFIVPTVKQYTGT